MLPFLPLFLRHDLGITDTGRLAFLSGLCTGATGIGLAVTGPLWGVLADRYGRKPMLLRSMLGGGASIALMGFAQGPLQLVGLRLLQGSVSGTIPAATALVAAETPRDRVGRALGVVTSSVALASAAGPLVGGVASSVIGLRALFQIGGVLLGIAAIPIFLVVRETKRRRVPGASSPIGATLRAARPGTQAALRVLLAGQFLMQTCYGATTQLLVLKLLDIGGGRSSLFIGMAFAGLGLATAVSSVTYFRLVQRLGLLWIATGAALVMGLAAGASASAPSVALMIAAVAVFGLGFGALSPALSTMIGLETPRPIQATLFGFSSSFIAVGIGAGPFGAGVAVGRVGIDAALAATAAVALLLAGLLRLAGREPLQ